MLFELPRKGRFAHAGELQHGLQAHFLSVIRHEIPHGAGDRLLVLRFGRQRKRTHREEPRLRLGHLRNAAQQVEQSP